jgi:hypothetical protein
MKCRLFIFCILLLASAADAAIVVRPEKFSLENPTVGQSFDLRIYLDSDPQSPGDQSYVDGLLSVAVRLVFPPSAFTVNAITPKGQLDHLGNGESADNDIDPITGSAGFRGNTPKEVPPQRAYLGTLLAYVDITPLKSGTFDLTCNPFDPSINDNFVDGAGTPLDSQIAFTSTTITVVPDPSSVSMTSLAIIFFMCRKRRTKIIARA